MHSDKMYSDIFDEMINFSFIVLAITVLEFDLGMSFGKV